MGIKLLVLLLALPLSSCATTYEVQRCAENGVCSFAKIRTYREFADGATVIYDPANGTFRFEAGSVTTAVSPIEQSIADSLQVITGIAAGKATAPE